MNSKVNLTLQIIATIIQVEDLATGLVPAKYKPFVALGVGILQAVSAQVAHYYNPDGTPASTAYVPPAK